MRRPIRTAVFAAADADVRKNLPSLLAACGISLQETAADGASAAEAVLRCRPDLLVADVLLPVLDGNALAERVLHSGSFPVRPGILLLYRKEFPASIRAKLEDAGAVYLPWPASEKDFCAAVDGEGIRKPAFSETEADRADQLLDALGVPRHAGREALKCAALLCSADERLLRRRQNTLYPMVGDMLGMAPAGVERAMRHVIGAAWQSDKFENQYRIFSDTVDARRGQPTCGEMIACLADILRLEG